MLTKQIAAAALFASLPALAQATQTPSQTTSAATHPAPAVVSASLKGWMDAKHAKVGDTVTAVTRSPAKLTDGVVLPAGTILTGRVSSVAPFTKQSGLSSLTLVFDSARPHNASPVAIRSVLMAIAPAPSSQISSEDVTATRGPVVAAGQIRGVTGTSGGIQSQNNSTPTSGYVDMRNTTDPATQRSDASSGLRTIAGNSSLADITLSAPSDGSNSGTLIDRGHNLQLEDGTKLALAIVPASQ